MFGAITVPWNVTWNNSGAFNAADVSATFGVVELPQGQQGASFAVFAVRASLPPFV
jgi:hypothetical protein